MNSTGRIQTFLKTPSYPGSVLRKLSMSQPESLLAAGGLLVLLLVLLGKLGNTDDCGDSEKDHKKKLKSYMNYSVNRSHS